MSERPKEHASKACEGNPLRGFKSHRHRHTGPQGRRSVGNVAGGALRQDAAGARQSLTGSNVQEPGQVTSISNGLLTIPAPGSAISAPVAVPVIL